MIHVSDRHVERKPFNLAEVRAKQLPRLAWRTLLTMNRKPDAEGPEVAEVMAESERAFDAYFDQFVQPDYYDGAQKCAGCGEVLARGGPGIAGILLGSTFTWGIAHGEGFCRNCGYPCRGLHYKVGIIDSLKLILQYHPDELEERKEGQTT